MAPKTQPNFMKLVKEKKSFLILVYLSLIIQLLITYSILFGLRNTPSINKYTKQAWWVYFIILIAIILLLTFVKMPTWLQFIVFTVFSIVFGCFLYSGTQLVSIELISSALEGAITVFLVMSVVAVILAYIGIDLSWMGMILFVALIGVLIASIIVSFSKDTALKKAVLFVILVLFAIFVLFQTNTMLQKNYNENFVQASLDFYLDFVNIFTAILGLDE